MLSAAPHSESPELASHVVGTGPIGAPDAVVLARRLFSRPSRVVLLGAAIGAMSMVDLYLTLLYLTHTGMSEANPLARAIIAYQSPMVLAVWKLLTVSACVGILFLIRHKRSAEMGAWVGVVVLGALMTHWIRYIDETEELKPLISAVASEIDEEWVQIDPASIGRLIP